MWVLSLLSTGLTDNKVQRPQDAGIHHKWTPEAGYVFYICSGVDEQQDRTVLSLLLFEGRFSRKREHEIAGNVKKST